MSFRLFIAKSGHAAMAGLVCLALVRTVHAQEGTRSIEVVPFHNSSTDTNFEQAPQDNSQSFQVWKSMAPNSVVASSPATRITPLPQSQQQPLSKEEQQLLDRRRNWVFMTPEDYASTDTKPGKNLLGTDDDKENNMTAMERYYHRLEQSSAAAATNRLNRMNSDRLSAQTNSYGNVARNNDLGTFTTPFNATPQPGVFQPIISENTASVFGKSDSSGPSLSPEEVRAQADHKTRMENYKQLWDIDQVSSAATPVTAPPSGPIDAGPLFGASSPGMSSFKQANSTSGGGFGNPSPTPTPKPAASPKSTRPPHSDFMPQQRPF